MVTSQEIERQLKAIGTKIGWWGRAEVKELEHIIEPGETIMYCINGFYDNGFAMLCITDLRVLLIDKKPLYLTLEDVRYDMISEVGFDGRLLDSSITIFSSSKQLKFTSFKGNSLRRATSYLQRRIMELRKHQVLMQQMIAGGDAVSEGNVKSFEHRITSPYTKVPLMLKRRVPKFHNNYN